VHQKSFDSIHLELLDEAKVGVNFLIPKIFIVLAQ